MTKRKKIGPLLIKEWQKINEEADQQTRRNLDAVEKIAAKHLKRLRFLETEELKYQQEEEIPKALGNS